MTHTDLRILDCTLRDGSYAINFQFTRQDTIDICAGLERAGLRLIEVGHGVGFRASQKGLGVAAETDAVYLEAAASVLTKAQFGAFCIPGIAELEDIDMAAGHGMGFIRIGTNVTEVERSAPMIEKARKHGMFVTANFMKSYASTPEEFAQKVLLSERYGSQAVYIVDSAGGMLEKDVDAYFAAVRDVTDLPIGFHGHNNLGLAAGHSLRAVALGATIIDTTLQGIGRSSGNVPTELFLLLLKRSGIDLGMDIMSLIDLGEIYIKPLLRTAGIDGLDLVGGFAQFHSSYMSVIRKYSTKYRIDPRRLIIELCAVDKVNAPEPLVDSLASRLSAMNDDVPTARYHWDKYFGSEQL